MKKQQYIHPTMQVVNIETPVIMAGSPPPPYGGGGGGSADSRELDIFDEE